MTQIPYAEKERELLLEMARHFYTPNWPMQSHVLKPLIAEIEAASQPAEQDGSGEPCGCIKDGLGLHTAGCPHNTPQPDPCAERAREIASAIVRNYELALELDAVTERVLIKHIASALRSERQQTVRRCAEIADRAEDVPTKGYVGRRILEEFGLATEGGSK